MSQSANADMIEGYRDGWDLSAPQPSGNRSASYCHGFMCARIDKGLVKWTGSPSELERLADEAMIADYIIALQQTPGA